VTVRLRLSTATKVAKALDEVLNNDRGGRNGVPRIGDGGLRHGVELHRTPHRQRDLRWRNHLLDDIKGYAGALEPRFKLGNAPLGIVNHNVNTVAGKNQA